MANLFKGYAQKSDFSGNLLKSQDPSDKILEEGRRYLGQWKEVSQGEQQNQINYLNALEAKFQAEEADRARNKKLESYFADGWEKALTKRHEGLIRNAESQLKATQNRAKKLEGWSDQAAQIGVDAAKGYAKARQDFGMNLAIDLGLSWDTAKGIQDATGVLDETYAGTNAAILEARKKGASWKQINQIHKLSFLGNQGFRVGVAMSAGENYKTNGLFKKQGVKYDFRGRKMSLNDATAEGNMEAYEVIRRNIRTDYMNEVVENTGISLKLLTKYARDNFIRDEGRIRTTLEEKSIKNEQGKIQAEQAELTRTRIKEGTYWDYIQKKFGPNGEGRAGVLAAEHNNVIDAISRGLLNAEDVYRYLDMPIEVDGKTVKYGDKFHKRALEIQTALTGYHDTLGRNQQRDEKARKAKLTQDTFNFRNELLNRDTPLEPSRIATMIAEADRLYGPENSMSNMLATFVTDHQGEANDKVYETTLNKLKSQGMVTTSIVKSMMLSPENEADWLKIAKEQDKRQPNEAELKILEDHVDAKVSELLKKFGPFETKDVSSAALAIYAGKENIKKYFTMQAQTEGLSRGDVLIRAMEMFEADVQKNYQIKTTGANDTYAPHFPTFSVSAQRHPVPLSEITSDEFAVNPKLPYEKLFLKPVTVTKFFDDVAQGRNVGFPPEVSNFVSKFGIGPNGEVKMTELMFLEAQMKLINPDFEIPKHILQTHKISFNQIKPEYQKYIVGAHQNTNSTYVALKYSGLNHKDLKTSDNYSDRNDSSYFVAERSPANFHWYLNLDPAGETDKLDWTERLIMGGSYG